jgi:hypothetical protein
MASEMFIIKQFSSSFYIIRNVVIVFDKKSEKNFFSYIFLCRKTLFSKRD